ncbi:folate family ECF transporter S component [Ligilactobacillus cholophilus]|uniref:folate family ECF transporter S component n=1 Tax=Ligilactobacillus cholophilus TaxID=3050131 RepID=UPI0025B0139F|nr:folate family ECF transporter S component [Ligilactobacillus cholophilus]
MSKLSWKSPKLNIRTVTVSALLLALQIILGKLSIGDPTVLKVGLGFIGTGLIGYLLGPWLGGVLLVLEDIVSHTIFSSGSVFFPGFTFSAFFTGVIAGMFLYQQKITWQRMFIYEFVQILVSNVIFTTLWLYILSMTSAHHTTFMALLAVRMPKEIISWPIESLVMFVILRAVSKIKMDAIKNN